MRLLYPDLLGNGNHLIAVRPRTFGTVIDSIGTPRFVSAVALFLNESIEADAVHLERWRQDARSASGYLVEWLGSDGVEYEAMCKVMDTYYRHYSDIDPLFQPVRGMAGTQLIQRDIGAIANPDFRQDIFERPKIAQECVLVSGSAKNQYALALARSQGQSRFSLDELFYFRQTADLLFPLFELHARTSAARRTTAVPVNRTPLERFEERLVVREVRLSRRESEICRLLLSGRTVPEAAQCLDVRLSTAESYVQRAFAKLGIRTKRELFDWALAAG